MTYGASFVATLAVESPFIGLEKIVIGGKVNCCREINLKAKYVEILQLFSNLQQRVL